MAWIYLFMAGAFEILWPVGLKLSQQPGKFAYGLAIAIGGLACSGTLLWLAQKVIPISIAYAVWTGIGAAGTFFVGIYFFGDKVSGFQMLSAFFIVGGVLGMRLAS